MSGLMRSLRPEELDENALVPESGLGKDFVWPTSFLGGDRGAGGLFEVFSSLADASSSPVRSHIVNLLVLRIVKLNIL